MSLFEDLESMFGDGEGEGEGKCVHAKKLAAAEKTCAQLLQANEQLAMKAKRLEDRAITMAETINALRQENKRQLIILERWQEGRPIE